MFHISNHQMIFYNLFTKREKKETIIILYSIILYIWWYKLSFLSLKHFKVNSFLYRHFKTSSSYLLSKTFGSSLSIRSFSQMHKSHPCHPQTSPSNFQSTVENQIVLSSILWMVTVFLIALQSNLYKRTTLGTTQKWSFWTDDGLIKRPQTKSGRC